MRKAPNLMWTLKDLRNFFLLEVVLLVGLIYVVEGLIGENGALNGYSEGVTTWILYLLQSVTLLIPLYLFTVYKHGSGKKDFGLVKIRKKELWKRVGQGFLMYYIISAIFLQISLSYDVKIPGFGEQETHVPLFGESLTELLLGGVIIVLIAPLIEELFFRGYLYQTLRKYAGVMWASVISAGLFSLFHLEFQVFIPIFVLGLVLNWIFERSRSLWTPILFHMLNNSLAFLLEIAVYFEWIELGL